MSGIAPRLIVATATGEGGDPLPVAAAVAVAASAPDRGEEPHPVVLADLRRDPRRPRGSVLASDASRTLEAAISGRDGLRAVARGRVCFTVGEDEEPAVAAAGLLDAAEATTTVAVCDPGDFRSLLELEARAPRSVLLRASRSDGPLISLLVSEMRWEGIPLRAWTRPVGPVAARRALAGLAAGGETGRRARRLLGPLTGGQRGGSPPSRSRRAGSRHLAGSAGQALPAVLGVAILVVALAVILVAIGGAATAKGRLQRGADLAAISAARSMRDDYSRLFLPATLPSGVPNPAHLSRGDYLARARAAAAEAAAGNDLDAKSVTATFPGPASIAPMRVRVRARVDFHIGDGGARPDGTTSVSADAEIAVAAPTGTAGAPAMAAGGGYSGPLAYRQGQPMRPDVAAAFDAMAAAARSAGISLVINSAYRSDAEQQRLWDANPDPRWVAPPGTSLHRCATELDLGPSSAYGWLAANAGRFGFLRRYSWEAWHFGFVRGPAPCSAAGNSVGSTRGDGRAAGGGGLPSFVPGQYREPLLRAASRHGVSAALLAAQIMAESSFDPSAVSAAGAQGIAQFMPATAAAYGLGDPFDPVAAIDAQARLMADLLRQFGSVELALAAYNAGPGAVSACGCVPPYPETQAYVTRILALLDGAGAGLLTGPPVLEVRLVR